MNKYRRLFPRTTKAANWFSIKPVSFVQMTPSSTPAVTPATDCATASESRRTFFHRPGATTHEANGKGSVSPGFLEALAGGLVLWAAFPPLGLWPLAWVAPLFWLRLIDHPKLGGGPSYRAIYLAGFLHWLLLLQGIRLPHWSAYFGWVALAAYLGCYIPLFIWLARVSVHRMGLSIVVAAPVLWTGLELLRGYLLTGFSLALLGHTQVAWTELIQIADLVGAYGVSFIVMFVAACLVRAIPGAARAWSAWPLIASTFVLVCALTYGYARLTAEPVSPRGAARARVAIIQGSMDTQFGIDAEEIAKAFAQYRRLSLEAVEQNRDLDLIVWPESMFTSNWPLVTYENGLVPPADYGLPADEFRQRLEQWGLLFDRRVMMVAEELRAPLLVGSEALHFGPHGIERYNSAILTDRLGKLAGRYDKMHPVMFGEYVPLGEWFPWLYRLTPMSGGLTAGRRPVSFPIAGLRLAPSICFENTVPHLIRRQVVELAAAGQAPDVLVTLTNDGWFWGSSLLDLHLTCGIFRAVETRLPMLIAANTGFSAWIDGNGRVLAKGPRRATAVVVADVAPDGRSSAYIRWGDWFAGVCLTFCGVAVIYGLWTAACHWRLARQCPKT